MQKLSTLGVYIVTGYILDLLTVEQLVEVRTKLDELLNQKPLTANDNKVVESERPMSGSNHNDPELIAPSMAGMLITYNSYIHR